MGPAAPPDIRCGCRPRWRRRQPASCRCHIALQKAVHGGAAGQIGQNFVYGPALGTGGGEGERCPEGGRVEPLHGCTGGGTAPVLHPSNAQLEHQQLLVDEPPPGCKSLLFRGRAVDGPHSIGLGEQAVFFQHLLWQRVGQEFRMGEQLPDAFCDHGAGKPLGLGVDGSKGEAVICAAVRTCGLTI